ncbi:MAG: Ribonuclease E [Wolbachia endosymbiont of Ctenocephalides orientis wCori]|nr:MAG: Ribonuclease E [Wolbachia endosymbiont of Ctenocephalides orientis wCori]
MENSGKKRLLLIENSIYSNEVRIALSVDNKVMEFEQEFRGKKRLRGNVYVAIVKDIAPSLQAVFIEYDKDKRGFLSFSDISPDYFNIPEEDKKALLESYSSDDCVEEADEDSSDDCIAEADEGYSSDNCVEENDNDQKANTSDPAVSKNNNKPRSGFVRKVPLKKYKLQDVISVGQKILVQLTKEERKDKGASFTTYVNLVGRYCVFMPNSISKGGVSRFIKDANVKKQLKEILSSINLPKRSGLIIRTAGSGKSKKEIEQDYSCLSTLWERIQKSTSSINTASLVYNEIDVVMRSVRDFCNDGTEIVVSGKEALEAINQYIKNALKGSRLHCRLHKKSVPIFTYYGIEDQISELYSNRVKLPSGGSLIITLTEAFVSIDVNSGKMTDEGSIEETAYRTNMEAVPEIFRQVNLRGLSGLIVVDFIDMLRYQNCRNIENAIRQAFKDDKAKVQFSYINNFGMMVFSRQRIKSNIQEINTTECAHCKGVGRVKSNEVIVASILRDLQYLANKNRNKIFDLVAHSSIVAHIFNNKRDTISMIENEYNIVLNVSSIDNLNADIFTLRHRDEIHSNHHEPLKNSGCQENEKSSINEGADDSNKPQRNFWLTRWLLRFL